MKICSSGISRCTIFFLWLIASMAALSGWESYPPLKMEYQEHEFLAACREGNVAAVEFYERQQDFNINRDFASGVTGGLVTGLHLAAQNGHANVVQILVGAGADLNQAWKGITPLWMASQNGHAGVVKILVGAGAEVNKARSDGATPLLQASYNGHADVVQILVDAGAEVNKARLDGVTPLFQASHNGHVDVVKILVAAKADLNQAWNGATPLFQASQNGHADVVQVLVDAGADLDQAWSGATPLFQASQNGYADVVKILVDAGADPTIKWKYGFGLLSTSPLTIARNQKPFRRQKGEHISIDASNYEEIISALQAAKIQWKSKKH